MQFFSHRYTLKSLQSQAETILGLRCSAEVDGHGRQDSFGPVE
jgi:hypothetical protein